MNIILYTSNHVHVSQCSLYALLNNALTCTNHHFMINSLERLKMCLSNGRKGSQFKWG